MIEFIVYRARKFFAYLFPIEFCDRVKKFHDHNFVKSTLKISLTFSCCRFVKPNVEAAAKYPFQIEKENVFDGFQGFFFLSFFSHYDIW